LSASVSEPAHVELRSVRLAFGQREVFRDLTFCAPRGRISVLMGGSGAGKSTVLRMVGGLLRPDGGEVQVAGEEIVGLDEKGLDRVRRRLGMLFQNGALLDSMTIFDNVALPLREHTSLAPDAIRTAVHERLLAVGLEKVDDLLPGELSGGMLRRAALARAIVEDPEILLCDEPFSGLDPPNVERIEALLTRLNRELGLTVLVTSHHMASSLRMGHQLVLLREGDAICGTPRELASSPDEGIGQFLGADGQAYLKTLSNGPAQMEAH
jgi:phospholipid/cholesterol/gamma-HCH transport system ATP-binding protein